MQGNFEPQSQAVIPLGNSLLSIVVPVYNEEEVLPAFHRRLVGVLDTLPMGAEILYVNDGSTDDSLRVLQSLRESDPRISIVDLSRNFGKEYALTAGCDYAQGDAAVVIDADLQDPPELIPQLVKHWVEGYDVIYAQRIGRDGESWIKKGTAFLFYRILRQVSRIEIPKDTGDFRLMTRKALEALRKLPEHHRFMKGLFAWIGFSQKAVPYHRDSRYAGTTKWNYWKLWNFALEGFTSFTTAPLRAATYLGVLVAIVAFSYAGVIAFEKLAYGNEVPGYPSLMVVILFLGGIQLITIGVLGEYLGRMFNETKRRPLYLVKSYAPRANQKGGPAPSTPEFESQSYIDRPTDRRI
jgi:glycosyltransferase involved in cell wall biosynthesis